MLRQACTWGGTSQADASGGLTLAARRGGVFGAGIGGGDDGGDAAARAEVGLDDGPDGFGGGDDVVEDLVADVFLEDAERAVVEEVFLEALELEAVLVRHVADGEDAEIGEGGFGADAGEFGVVDEDFIAGKLVFPDVDGGEGVVEAGGCVGIGVAGVLGAHGAILLGFLAGQEGGWVRKTKAEADSLRE